MRSLLADLLAGTLVLSWLGCAAPVPRTPIPSETPILLRENQFPPLVIDDADRESLQKALERSLAYLEGGKSTSQSAFPPRVQEKIFSAERVLHSLTLLREILRVTSREEEVDRKIRENFIFWEFHQEVSGSPFLLTGYYEPILEGSLDPGGEYQYPIYCRPGDLIELSSEEVPGKTFRRRQVRMEEGRAVPYYSRREIDTEGVLRGKGLELAWLKDPWERFVLHIQGSGQIRLPDGKKLPVGFAASNGRPYRSIGRYLIDRGFLSEKEVNLERIKEFLQQNRGWAEEIYNINERYIFFRPLHESEVPLGALGVPLTPGRSIATDLSIFPPGALGYLISRQPVFDEAGKMAGWKPLQRLVFNQDTGAAMKGPSRVDLFFGSGEEAGKAAAEMKEEGRIYILLAK